MKQFFLTNLSVVLSLLGTLLTVSVTFLVFWLKERGQLAKRQQQLAEAKSRIDFWSSWRANLVAVNPLSEAEEKRFLLETDRAASLVEDLFRHWPRPATWTPAAFRSYLNEVGLIRRLLLLYRQRSREATLIAVLIYTAMVFSAYSLFSFHIASKHFLAQPASVRYERIPAPAESRDGAPLTRDPDGKVSRDFIRQMDGWHRVMFAAMALFARIQFSYREHRWLKGLRDK